MCCTIQKIPYPFKRTQFLRLRRRQWGGSSATYFYRLEQRFPPAGKINQAAGLPRRAVFDYFVDRECFRETRNAGIWPPPLVTLAKPVALRRVK